MESKTFSSFIHLYMYLSVCMCVCMCAYNCKGHLLVDVENRLMEFTVTFWVYSVVRHIGISGAQLGKWKVGQTMDLRG